MSSISPTSGHAAHAMTHAPRPPKPADQNSDQIAKPTASNSPSSDGSSKGGVNIIA
ncbi:MAG TPA: hypothetical protein VLJ20_15315 [Acetobacteraceae bacterium]|nr:hypothetical protein [Acetobacteraceae bacterium]